LSLLIDVFWPLLVLNEMCFMLSSPLNLSWYDFSQLYCV